MQMWFRSFFRKNLNLNNYSRINSFENFLKLFPELKPLSNFDIINYCNELHIDNFKGVCMRDELNNSKFSANESLVINLDVSSGNGIHWMCLFSKNGVSYYFDSYGLSPPREV